MAEKDGQTCTTCMTLNPVGAPACVRCNSPLPAAAPRAEPAGPPRAADPAADAAADPAADPAAVPWSGSGSAVPTGPAGSGSAGGWIPPPDPLTGSKRLGPGLAGSGRAAPGSSRAAAVPDQPPGYGLDPPAAPPEPAGPTPAELRRARHRIAVAGLVVVALVLLGGGAALWLTRPRYVDTAAVGRTIGAELTARLGDRVTVECPGSPRREPHATFRCTARDTRGVQQAVTVTLLDDTGRYRWQLGG